jgi:hypothetical protein
MSTIIRKKNRLDQMKNPKLRLQAIYEWCISGMIRIDEFSELINHCRLGISKQQMLKSDRLHPEDYMV